MTYGEQMKELLSKLPDEFVETAIDDYLNEMSIVDLYVFLFSIVAQYLTAHEEEVRANRPKYYGVIMTLNFLYGLIQDSKE